MGNCWELLEIGYEIEDKESVWRVNSRHGKKFGVGFQGYVIGPLLFLIFNNDMEYNTTGNVLSSLTAQKFSDKLGICLIIFKSRLI